MENKQRMKRFLMLTGVLAGVVLLSGCASSRRDVVYSDLMEQLRSTEEPELEGPDEALTETPDVPMGIPMDGSVPSAVPGPEIDDSGGALTIQPDSVLRITVAEDPGLGGSYPVNDLGAIQLGYIGPVILYNLTERGAAEKLRQILLGREFHSATVTVKILRPSYDKVKIAGHVRKPGLIRVGAGDEVTLNNALAQAGGITETPWNARVKIVRGGLQSIMAPYLPGEVYGFLDDQQRPRVPDVKLRNNDVAFVYTRVARRNRITRQRPKWVLVLGEVNAQGFYRFTPAERFTMMNLIFKMGGLPAYANDKAIRVIREDEEGIEHEYRINAREIMREGDPELDFELEPGDRIIVPARRISIF